MSKTLAIYNGFKFHYEVMGYILHYCFTQGHHVIVYCDIDNSNGYITLFQQLFGQESHEYRPIERFDTEKCCYDAIFLLTDDDMSFSTNDQDINRKTIRIDHDFFVRRPEIQKCIATRPFLNGNGRPWALPCYPIIGSDSKLEILRDDKGGNRTTLDPKADVRRTVGDDAGGSEARVVEASQNEVDKRHKTHIVIVNNDYCYHSSIINRLQSGNPIVIHAISRDMDASRFSRLRDDIELHIYKNIDACALFRIVAHSDFVLTDVSVNPEYENIKMSGAIPLAFSMLVPLIISKQTNSHYQFKNIIEFDKYGREPIVLEKKSIEFYRKLEGERVELIETFFQIMHSYLE